MFLKASHLLASAVLATLGPLAALSAQAPMPVRTGGGEKPQAESKVTWSLPGQPGTVDSLSLCAVPLPATKIAPKRVVKRTAPKMAYTPTAKPVAKPRRAAAPKPKPALPAQPKLQCPQVNIGPTMMGTLDAGESIVPMPGDLYADVPSMPLIVPRAFPVQEFPTVAAVNGGSNRWAPLIWLFGGGAGVTIFTKFVDGDDDPKDPRNPLVPNPPPIENPEIPPVTTTPEPGTLILVGTGLAGIAGAYRRRGRKNDVTTSDAG